MALRFDLQSHSTHSDGALGAAEVVKLAAEAGVELLALSDHDTISGVAEAIEAGERHGVRVVSAVEISAVDADSPVPRELHILGYKIDHTGPPMTDRLVDFLADREKRTLRMRDALREVGFELDEAELEQRIAEGKPIGRPHLAAAVLGAPANAQRLEDEEIDDVGSLIRGYLIEGKPAFRLRETPTVAEAIEAIHDAGGVAIWAHPFWDIEDDGEVLDEHRALPRARHRRRRGLLRHPRRARRRACSPPAAKPTACSAPARPTTTAPRTACSRASWRSRPTASSRTSGRSPPDRAFSLHQSDRETTRRVTAPRSAPPLRRPRAARATPRGGRRAPRARAPRETLTCRRRRVSCDELDRLAQLPARLRRRVLLELCQPVDGVDQLGRSLARRTARRAATARPAAA